jgi:spermidine synthase
MSAEIAAPMPGATASSDLRTTGLTLFLVGFLVLFLELACIRWFAAYVIFLQFFTNVVLLASFLGMSCGCMAARKRYDWLGQFPALALFTVTAALVMLAIYQGWTGLAVDVGHQSSPQEVFFGTEYRNPDVAQFAIPIELIVAVFFLLISLLFVGLGQALGRAFDAYPNRVVAYTLNIGGSLAGIVAFTGMSLFWAPPAAWFLVVAVGMAYLLHQHRMLSVKHAIILATLVLMVEAPDVSMAMRGEVSQWSPYYAVRHVSSGQITVNTIGHQTMVPFDRGGSTYSLIHLLQRATGGKPFQDALIIGAGSGNDLDHALHFGVGRVDAVEIDPVIQSIGIRENPDHPYQDPRVVRHLDDGRHFLRTTDQKYDLVVYALVDSLILHSGYSNLRLESFLFTQEAFNDIKRVLKPGGTFITYNFFRQGWIVERVAAMAERTFGCKPVILSLPYEERLTSSSPAGFTIVITGCNRQILQSFDNGRPFWLNTIPPQNLDVNGFTVQPTAFPADQQEQWQKIAPTTIVHDGQALDSASDDWPFLYLQNRLVPSLSLRSMVMLGGLGVAMVYFFLPKGRMRLDNRMFFLGAAFMLLETKAVVQLALLFGSTWLVNSLVFFTVLVLILAANLYVLRHPTGRLTWHYGLLFLLLALGTVVPFDMFIAGGIAWRYVLPCVLALGPMFFAGVIFARSFRDTAFPDQAFGSNIAGAVLGGLSEPFSMLLGFHYLLLLAILFYALSIWSPSARVRTAGVVPMGASLR